MVGKIDDYYSSLLRPSSYYIRDVNNGVTKDWRKCKIERTRERESESKSEREREREKEGTNEKDKRM